MTSTTGHPRNMVMRTNTTIIVIRVTRLPAPKVCRNYIAIDIGVSFSWRATDDYRDTADAANFGLGTGLRSR